MQSFTKKSNSKIKLSSTQGSEAELSLETKLVCFIFNNEARGKNNKPITLFIMLTYYEFTHY